MFKHLLKTSLILKRLTCSSFEVNFLSDNILSSLFYCNPLTALHTLWCFLFKTLSNRSCFINNHQYFFTVQQPRNLNTACKTHTARQNVFSENEYNVLHFYYLHSVLILEEQCFVCWSYELWVAADLPENWWCNDFPPWYLRLATSKLLLNFQSTQQG